MARHYDDDYEGSSFEKFTHRKSKSHKKGHQSRGMNSEKVRWQKIMEEENEDLVELFKDKAKVLGPIPIIEFQDHEEDGE